MDDIMGGRNKYARDPEVVDGSIALSNRGFDMYLLDVKQYRDRLVLREQHTNGLMTALLDHITSESLTILETYGGEGGFNDLVGTRDTFGPYELISRSHMVSSHRSKHKSVVDWVSLTQGSLSHEKYVVDFNHFMDLVVDYFGSAAHPGYVKIEPLATALYLHGLDPIRNARPIERATDEFPNDTLVKCQQRVQEYNTEHPVASASTEPAGSGRALVLAAASVSSVGTGVKVERDRPAKEQLPTYNPALHSAYCSHCWGHGYRNLHARDGCAHYLRSLKFQPRSQALLAIGGAVGMVGAAAAGASAVSMPPSSSARLPPPPSTLSDAAYIESFEGTVRQYQEAKARQAALNGRQLLCAVVEDVAALELSVSASAGALAAPLSNMASIEQSMADLAASLRASPVASAGTALLRDARSLISQLSALVSEVTSLTYDMWVWFWDNGASVHMTRYLTLLVDVQPLSHPFRVGGAVGGALLTHVGHLPFLPRALSKCYYSAELSVNLLSLNSIQRLGGAYASSGLDSLTVSAPDGSVLDVAKQLSNKLNVVSLPLLVAAYPDLVPPAASAFPEQRERMDRAEALHRGRAGHASDDVLCEALANGEFSWAEITGRDVRLNRQHRGPCPQCAQGKLRNKPMPPSVSQPSESVGSAIYFDCHELSGISPGGNKWAIRAIDEFSGDRSVTGAPSKSAASLYEALLYLVHSRYNAYGHRTDLFVSDPERSLLPVIAMLGRVNIKLNLIDPGQHGQRIESSIGKDDACIRALEAGLPMVWPAALEIYMLKFMADCKNALPNARSRPSTADILRTGRRRVEHYQFPGLSIGAVCVVQEHDPKRREAARVDARSYKFEDVGELGVLLGFSDDYPGDFIFLLANGQVVPRRVLKPVQVFPSPGFGGYEWKRNIVHHAEIASPVGSALPLEPMAPQLAVQGDSGQASAILPQGPAAIPSSVDQQPLTVSPMEPSTSVSSFVDLLVQSVPPVVASSPASISVVSPPSPVLPSSTATLSPLVPSPAASVLPTVRRGTRVSRPNTLFSKDEGYALAAGAKLAVPVSSCECYASPGFESFQCASCVAATWIVPRRVSSQLLAPDVSLAVRQSSPTDYLSAVLSAPVVVPPRSPSVSSRSRRLPSSAGSLPSRSDALTTSDLFWLSMAEISNTEDRAAIQLATETAALAAKVAYDAEVARETAVFDTQRADEFSLDEALGYYTSLSPSEYTGIPSGGAALASFVRASSSDLQSIPSTKCKEVPLSSALRTIDYEKMVRMTKAEIDKQQRIRCLGTQAFSRSQLPDGCGVVPGVALYKDKADGRETCRIAANGQRDTTTDPTVVTSTSVASDADKMCAIAAMEAHCASRGEELIMVSSSSVVFFVFHVNQMFAYFFSCHLTYLIRWRVSIWRFWVLCTAWWRVIAFSLMKFVGSLRKHPFNQLRPVP